MSLGDFFKDAVGAGLNIAAGNYVGAAGDMVNGAESLLDNGSSPDQVMQGLGQALSQFSPQQLQQLLSALEGGNSPGSGQPGGPTGFGGGPSGYEGYPGMSPEGQTNQGRGLVHAALEDSLKHKHHAEGAAGA